MRCTVKNNCKIPLSGMSRLILKEGKILRCEQIMKDDRVFFKVFLTPRISRLFPFHVFMKCFKKEEE